MKTVLRQDNDCHWYKIPADMASEFDSMLAHYENQEMFTDAYYDAEAEFCNKFSEYMTGSHPDL